MCTLSLLLSIACISKFSSGQVFYYPDFHHTKEVPRTKFEKDFRWMVTSFRLWYTSAVGVKPHHQFHTIMTIFLVAKLRVHCRRACTCICILISKCMCSVIESTSVMLTLLVLHVHVFLISHKGGIWQEGLASRLSWGCGVQKVKCLK